MLEPIEEIGTIRNEVAEHDTKQQGLEAKSLCSQMGWSFTNACLCCVVEEKPPIKFVCSFPFTTVLPKCVSSAGFDGVKNINFRALHALILPLSDQTQALVLIQETCR